jgi:general secretion pathway protein J
MKADRGFTLIEVLVAMTVMAVMAMMAWQGVDGIVRARDSSQGSLERTLRLDSVVAQWDQDLASLQDSNGAAPELACDGSTVRMTRRAEGGLQVVAWALRPSATDFTWWRWASPPVRTVGELQDNWVRTQQLQGGETGALKTITGLIGWQVYFYRGNGWSNCQSSNDVVAVAPPASGASGIAPLEVLPTGVRMVLTFAPGSGQSGSLVRDTLIGP